MSFGGYGGHPADPFGGQPFGSQQFGGNWPGPPTYPAPPPQPTPETNPLATLSIIFAFLFAPAGAVLGHVALSQIKRLHQKGRDRAIIGLVLSYFMTVVLVVALVVWAALPDKDEPKPAVAGPSTTTTPRDVTVKSIEDALLNGKELGKLLDQSFQYPAKYSVVGVEQMEDLSDPSEQVLPYECANAVTTGERGAYRSSEVQGFVRQTWMGVSEPDTYPAVERIFETIVELPTAEDAKTLLTQLTERWMRCEGTLMTHTSSTHDYVSTFTLTDVRTEDSVLAGTLLDGPSTYLDGPPLPMPRAVAVIDKYVIETRVDLFDKRVFPAGNTSTRVGSGNGTTSGVDIARAIVDKINKG